MIKLELTDEQAFYLRAVLDRVEGTMNSPRKHTHAIVSQLIDQGVGYDDNMWGIRGKVTFFDN